MSAHSQSPSNNEDADTRNTSNGKDDGHWDVVGLDLSSTQRRTFLGLLEGKTETYSMLGEDLPEFIYNLPAKLDSPFSSDSPDRYLFKNFHDSSLPPNSLHSHIASPNINQQQLVIAFKESLYPDNGTLPTYLKNQTRWISHLPPLTGTNPLLDAAVRAVTLVHIGRLNNSEPFVMESRPYYGQALRLLNKTLQDRQKGVQNETLCAVILLSFYEMFASDNNESWVRHAGGVSALMRARGPARHRYGLDREIFLAYRYMLIIESFQQDVPCFLAEPDWIKLSSSIHDDLRKSGVSSERMEIFNLAEEYYQAMVVLPAQAADARAMWEARQNGTPPPVSRAHLIESMTKSRIEFKATFSRFEAALKRAGHAPTIKLSRADPFIGIEYEFVNTFVAATYVGYWTVLTVLNMCLQGLQRNDKELVEMYAVESRDSALNICRSTAFMLTSSFLGPFFLIFGLRVGLLVFEDTDGPEADWILRKLFDIGDRHMSIAKHVPGYRPGITANELVAEFKLKKAQAKENNNYSEEISFARKVANGDLSSGNSNVVNQTSPFGASGTGWEGFNQLDDVLQTWDDQENFPILEMNNLNVNQSGANSGAGSRQNSPMPPVENTFGMDEQQFVPDSNAFAMPDLDLWDQNWNDIGMMGDQPQGFTSGQAVQPPQPPIIVTGDEEVSRFLKRRAHWNGGRMDELKQ